ncbi:MAG: thioredoxin family protein [Janthinobacterium lividum]
MARTPSNQDLPLGTTCPAFELTDVVTGKGLGRDDIFGGIDDAAGRKGLLVAFLSVHCPFVQHMEAAFSAVAGQYADRIATVAICSNDGVTVPEDAPEHMRAQAERLGWPQIGSNGLPYLADPSQETAREFHAACTPDLYLFNKSLELVYHAQFDATRPYRESDARNGVVKDERIHQAARGSDLRLAIEALLAGKPPVAPQIPSLGCNIKWRD